MQMASQLFWQWFNQSYNVGVNHANRNASNQMSNNQIMLAYSGATFLCVLAYKCHPLITATTLTPQVPWRCPARLLRG
jgi:hypothetical protein